MQNSRRVIKVYSQFTVKNVKTVLLCYFLRQCFSLLNYSDEKMSRKSTELILALGCLSFSEWLALVLLQEKNLSSQRTQDR